MIISNVNNKISNASMPSKMYTQKIIYQYRHSWFFKVLNKFTLNNWIIVKLALTK